MRGKNDSGVNYAVISSLSGTTTPRGAAPFKEPEGKPARGKRTPSASAPRQSPLNRAALEKSRSLHSAMEDDARRLEGISSGARRKVHEAPREQAPDVVKDPRKSHAGKRGERAREEGEDEG